MRQLSTFISIISILGLLLLVSCTKRHPEAALSLGKVEVQPPLSPQRGRLLSSQRLRRLKFHLRGFPPDTLEYEQLEQALSNGQSEAFFSAKTKEYIASPEYIGKMIQRVNELFRLRVSGELPEKGLVSPRSPQPRAGRSDIWNSFDQIVESIARDNLSWDLLLTSTNYRIGDRDRYFLSALVTNPPQSFLSPIAFNDNDARIAGVLTTSRFFNRYSTTSRNKSRGRAAALFRIFLCDQMTPAVVVSAEAEKELLELAFSQRGSNRVTDPHGTQASCMACHYKLDPLGRTFLTSTTILSEQPSPGSLVFQKVDGSLLNLSGRGLGDVARGLAGLAEYERCQVKHLWRWFVRGDAPPSFDRLNALTAEFARVGHRLNDMVGYLVNQPEFYDIKETEIPISTATLVDVKPILNRCDKCHGDSIVADIPSFTKFPIGGAMSHVYWLERIASRLDLPGNGTSRSMPPPDSDWIPSLQDIVLIADWVRAGAKDEKGVASLDAETAIDLVKPR